MPPSQAVSSSRNASAFDVPCPKNAGDEPMPPKLPQPRMIRVIAMPLPPRGRSSIRPILRQRRSRRGRGSDRLGSSRRPDRQEEVQPMSYVAADDRYDQMRYNRCGRSGLALPAISLGLWHNFGGITPARDGPGDRAARLRPRRHALRPREQLRPALRLGGGELRPAHAGRPPALPRRAGHLDEGRLRHVARPVRRRRLAQVPAREPRPEPRAARPRLRRHLLLASRRPHDAARGDDGRARQRRPRRARRSTSGSRRTRPRRRARRTRSSAISARRS